MLSKIISLDSPELYQIHIKDISASIDLHLSDGNNKSSDSLMDLLIARATLLNKVGKYNESIIDCERALNDFDKSNSAALYQKGIACYNLQQYQDALSIFNDLLSNYSSLNIFKEWKSKCEKSIPKQVPSSTESNASSIPAKKKIRYDWYQSPTDVVLTILAKDTNPEKAKILISENSLNVSLPDQDDFSLEVELFSSINVKASSYKISSTKVEVKLSKLVSQVNWPALEKSKNPVLQTGNASTSQKLPSAYAKKTPDKWNEIEKEVGKELDAEKPKGDAAFMHLMQKIYKDADEDTRRAMNKSYQTSGGTVLSTNWGEVAKKDYEREEEEKRKKGGN